VSGPTGRFDVKLKCISKEYCVPLCISHEFILLRRRKMGRLLRKW